MTLILMGELKSVPLSRRVLVSDMLCMTLLSVLVEDEDDDLPYSVLTGMMTTLFHVSDSVPSFRFLIMLLTSPEMLLNV
jgi:hypothetical protein